MDETAVPIKPILQAIVLADHIYKDGATGKGIIAGTFNCLFAPTFPTDFGRLTDAFVCLTGVRGKQNVVLRYVDLEDNEVLMECEPIEVEAEDPLQSVEVTVRVPPIPMPHEGTFAFEAHVGGELLGFLRISVFRVPADADEDEEPETGEEQ